MAIGDTLGDVRIHGGAATNVTNTETAADGGTAITDASGGSQNTAGVLEPSPDDDDPEEPEPDEFDIDPYYVDYDNDYDYEIETGSAEEVVPGEETIPAPEPEAGPEPEPDPEPGPEPACPCRPGHS